MAVFDTTALLCLLDPDANAPYDMRTGQPVVDAKIRVQELVESLATRRERILVPTPVLSEVLVHAGEATRSYLKSLANTSRFRIAPFDERSAIELAEMTRRAYKGGDLRAGTDATRAQLRFDRQILAIARVQGEDHVYTDDSNMRTFAKNEGFRVTGVQDVPLPSSNRQTTISPSGDPPSPELDSDD